MDFSLSYFDWIGFDVDHTLIRYRLSSLHDLIYNSMREYLCRYENYSEDLMKIDYDEEFAVKGLIYDGFHGNLIQINSKGFVENGFHGVKTRLSMKILEELYPDALESIEHDSTGRFRCYFTYFEQSVLFLIGCLVDFVDKGKFENGNEKNYKFFLSDINKGFEFLFGDYQRGNYFSSIRENPSKFIYRRDEIRNWLEKVRSSGKKLFLLTNSRFDYTNLLCSFSLGDDWKNLFDLIVVDAKKDSFFVRETDEKKTSFVFIDENGNCGKSVTIDEIFDRINETRIYSMGNSFDLSIMMSKWSEKTISVLYFGDHLKSDIVALKLRTNWTGALILEELEFESPTIVDETTFHHTIETKSSYEIGRSSKYFSNYFGSKYFSQENDRVPMNIDQHSSSSYWDSLIRKYASFSLSCLSVLANHFHPEHVFRHDKKIEHFVILDTKLMESTRR